MFRMLVFLPILLIVACASKPLCPVATEISKRMAGEFSGAFGCDATEVEKDVLAQLPKANICDPSDLSVIGDLICPSLVGRLFSGGVQLLPPRWKCKGGPVGDQLKDKAIEFCRKSI